MALVDVARDAALRQGKTVLLHTLEMSCDEVIWRILAAEARIPLSAVLSRSLSAEDWARIAHARAVFEDAPLHVVDTPNLTTADLRASINRLHPDPVVIDYVQRHREPAPRTPRRAQGVHPQPQARREGGRRADPDRGAARSRTGDAH